MKVLVACEFSGIVRDAFAARGHDAWSCDLLATERPSQFHYQGTIESFLRLNPYWDLMIAFPVCTYLSLSGVRWLYENGKGTIMDLKRWELMEKAADFFHFLLNYKNIKKRCLENPIQHRHTELPKYSQKIQPWQFGHGETKATCLWLVGLPPLMPTSIVTGREQRVFREPPSNERWKNRSRTYSGIAKAMAEQWG